jgi:hypothetical protein
MSSKPKKEDWMKEKWRPMMGWMYMATCISDFIVFPVLWSILQAIQGGQVTSQWNPLTLQGAGLFHLAMGAVLGVAAWSRGQEKINGAANTPMMQSTGYNNSYQPTTGFTPSYAARPTARVTTGIGGRPAPVQDLDPEL